MSAGLISTSFDPGSVIYDSSSVDDGSGGAASEGNESEDLNFTAVVAARPD